MNVSFCHFRSFFSPVVCSFLSTVCFKSGERKGDGDGDMVGVLGVDLTPCPTTPRVCRVVFVSLRCVSGSGSECLSRLVIIVSPSLTNWIKSRTLWSRLTRWNTTGLKFLCSKDLTRRTVTTASPAMSCWRPADRWLRWVYRRVSAPSAALVVLLQCAWSKAFRSDWRVENVHPGSIRAAFFFVLHYAAVAAMYRHLLAVFNYWT